MFNEGKVGLSWTAKGSNLVHGCEGNVKGCKMASQSEWVQRCWTIYWNNVTFLGWFAVAFFITILAVSMDFRLMGQGLKRRDHGRAYFRHSNWIIVRLLKVCDGWRFTNRLVRFIVFILFGLPCPCCWCWWYRLWASKKSRSYWFYKYRYRNCLF